MRVVRDLEEVYRTKYSGLFGDPSSEHGSYMNGYRTMDPSPGAMFALPKPPYPTLLPQSATPDARQDSAHVMHLLFLWISTKVPELLKIIKSPNMNFDFCYGLAILHSQNLIKCCGNRSELDM